MNLESKDLGWRTEKSNSSSSLFIVTLLTMIYQFNVNNNYRISQIDYNHNV